MCVCYFTRITLTYYGAVTDGAFPTGFTGVRTGYFSAARMAVTMSRVIRRSRQIRVHSVEYLCNGVSTGFCRTAAQIGKDGCENVGYKSLVRKFGERNACTLAARLQVPGFVSQYQRSRNQNQLNLRSSSGNTDTDPLVIGI